MKKWIALILLIGITSLSHAEENIIRRQNLDRLRDVDITSPANNELLAYDNASSMWINQTPTEAGLDAIYVKRDGTTELTADWNVGAFDITVVDLTATGTVQAEQLTSTDDITMQGHLFTMGSDTTPTDIVLSFLSNANDATITFDVSADDFLFGNANITSTGSIQGGIISDGIATLFSGNLTDMGNITGTDVDISAGTGDYSSTGTLTVGDFTGTNITLSGASILANATANGVLTLGGVGGSRNHSLTIDNETLSTQTTIETSASDLALFSSTGDIILGKSSERLKLAITGNAVQITGFDGIDEFLLLQMRLGIQDFFPLNIGSGNDTHQLWSVTGNDNFQFGIKCGLSSGSGYWSLMNRDHVNNANRSPLELSVDPVHRIYSSDVTQPNDYIEMFHNQSGGVIKTGIGNIDLDANFGAVNFFQGSTKHLILVGGNARSQVVFGPTGGGGGSQIVLTGEGTVNQNFDHPNQTNPTYFIHSVIGPNISNNQWGSFHHDQEDFVITTGANIGAGSSPTTNRNAIILKGTGGTLLGADGGITDYAIFAPDGELNLFGTARFMCEFNLEPVTAGLPSANFPANDNIDNFFFHRFDRSTEESVTFHFEIPHSYVDAGAIHIHNEFIVRNPPAGGGSDEAVVLGVEYKKVSPGEVFDFTGTTTVTVTETITAGETPDIIHIDSGVTLVTTGFVAGDVILIRLFRDATNVDDTYDNEGSPANNDVWMFNHHLEYLCNKLGEST